MQSKFLILFLSVGFFFGACQSDTKEANTTASTTTDTHAEQPTAPAEPVADVPAGNFAVETNASVINWKGSKKVGDAHNGTIKLKSGAFTITDGKLIAGHATIDMASIVNVDLTDPKYNAKLVKHLNSADFFDVASHPTATLVVTSVNDKGFDAKLKMKGIEKAISIPGKVTKEGDNYVVTLNTFKIDRTEWGVKYNSGKFFQNLKDKLINDDIEIGGKIVLAPKG